MGDSWVVKVTAVFARALASLLADVTLLCILIGFLRADSGVGRYPLQVKGRIRFDFSVFSRLSMCV